MNYNRNLLSERNLKLSGVYKMAYPYISTPSCYKQVLISSHLFSSKAARPREMLSRSDREANSVTKEASHLNISKQSTHPREH